MNVTSKITKVFFGAVGLALLLVFTASPSYAQRAEVVKDIGNLPAFFIENRGQTAEAVRYYFRGSDSVYFTDDAVVFQKTGTRAESDDLDARHRPIHAGHRRDQPN